jgi:hypothetical protein
MTMDRESISESKAVHEVKIDMPKDPEPRGYDRLASLMGFFPELAVYRRFAKLNAKNILYLQSELSVLERELQEASREDAQSTNDTRQEYSRTWVTLSHSDLVPEGSPNQWNAFRQIREVLQQYSQLISCCVHIR